MLEGAEELKKIEENIKTSEKAIELKNAFIRLENNEDFKNIVSEGYFKDLAVRLVQLKSEPVTQTEARQANIMTAINGIGSLYQYFQGIVTQGNVAEDSMLSLKQEKEECLQELDKDILKD